MLIKIAIGIIAVILLGFFLFMWLARKWLQKQDPDYVLTFVKEHHHKKNCALFIKKDHQIVCAINENEPLPLASMVKYIVGIEYAKQAAAGIIQADSEVSLEALNTFYIKNTDGGAHPAWEASMRAQHKIKAEHVTVKDVAKGMLQFSSNANTDYLINLLGLDSINKNLNDLQLSHHDKLYPLVASLYIPNVIQQEQQLQEKEVLALLKSLSKEDYRNDAIAINEKIKTKQKLPALTLLNKDVQEIWSNFLPAASAADYMSLLEKINSKTYFEPAVQHHLDEILESLMEQEENRQWLKHAGQKGGSTSFVLTNGFYGTDRHNHTFEMVFMANHLEPLDATKLRNNLRHFQLHVVKNSNYAEKVKAALSS
ncbi:D-alanyl-D-alanine carboxypeptidase [Fictibacillus macauensis ZFHKF-1]|uniref:D-alanyl-D-alanine carboxypeptidase n=1 Tax=Fictibacillus macauensis ZFHKF-1 TaxID=1196324 RepID=I8J2V6_9BACL|nr:serine hydrolase [Fictibacillus macauensis]EIT86081.1 D-alanyl-D-alanine carboxypeptidase [Fictibacillus macauensis ZFHKF-1]